MARPPSRDSAQLGGELMKRLATCGEAIPEPRLLAIPFTRTCSAACTRQRDLWRKRKAAKRVRERRKAARAKPTVSL